MSFISKDNSYSISQVEVYYLPWNYRTEGRLTVTELENLKDEQLSFFCSRNRQLINNLKALLDTSNLTPFPEIDEIEPYMILDLTDNNNIQRVILDRKQLIQIDKSFYHSNLELRTWVYKNIPAAGFPIGIRTNEDCKE